MKGITVVLDAMKRCEHTMLYELSNIERVHLVEFLNNYKLEKIDDQKIIELLRVLQTKSSYGIRQLSTGTAEHILPIIGTELKRLVSLGEWHAPHIWYLYGTFAELSTLTDTADVGGLTGDDINTIFCKIRNMNEMAKGGVLN